MENNAITTLLSVVLIFMLILLVILIIVYVILNSQIPSVLWNDQIFREIAFSFKACPAQEG